MRTFSRCFSAVIALVVLAAGAANASAQDRASLQGFGGLPLNGLTSTSLMPSLGGTLTVSLTPMVQIVGEAGRLGNVLPRLSNAAFSVGETGLRVSAFYGEAGARIVVAPASVFTPYLEGTAGVSRLDIHSDRLSPTLNAATSLALGLVGRTAPTVGAGGGFLLQGGPVLFDVGYRYKQLLADDVMEIVLGFGQRLRTHELRVGLGVKF